MSFRVGDMRVVPGMTFVPPRAGTSGVGWFVVRAMDDRVDAWIDLFWLPLGAGGHVVRWSGRVYERVSACTERRTPRDLFHAALLVRRDAVTYAVEMGPVWNVGVADRGVVCEGPVGARWLGRSRAFRYEVRCWPGGRIPDVAEAVASPVRTTRDPKRVALALATLHDLPTLTWGRDELGAGEMWNSNSVVAYTLARSGHDLDLIEPPIRGRAPGWRSGVRLAERQSLAARLTR